MDRIGLDIRKRHLLAGVLPLGLIALVAASPKLLGDQVRSGLEGIGNATPAWLWVAALGFVASLALSGFAWRAALRSCGAEIGYSDAAARYGVGCLVNSIAPAKLGTALRLALYAQPLHGEGRLWTVGGIGTAIGAAQTLWLAILVAVAASAGVLPVWPLAILAGLLIAAGIAIYVARHSRPARRFAHVLDAFRAIGSSPRRAATLLGWTGLAMVARVSAAAALAFAFALSARDVGRIRRRLQPHVPAPERQQEQSTSRRLSVFGGLFAATERGLGRFGAWRGLDSALGRALWAQLISVGTALVVGTAAYLVSCRLLGVRELNALLALRERLPRR